MTHLPAAYRTAPERAPAGIEAGMYVADLSRLGEDTDGPVLFLLGMRINRWRRVRSWVPVAVAMPRMLRELRADPAIGLLSAQLCASGRDLVSVQYWRSADDLGRFARNPEQTHAPAWAAFNRATAGTGDVGVWHETYAVTADTVETRYGNMPPAGLGAVLGTVGRAGRRRTRTDVAVSP